MRDFAKRLIAYETMKSKSSKTNIPMTFPVSEKLRPQLATLMGNVGFTALLSRALALAEAEVPWLRSVHVEADGSFKVSDEAGSQIDPGVFFEGRVVLLAQLLGLLVAFIGDNLTLRLVRDVWPLNNLDFDEGVKNEKTK